MQTILGSCVAVCLYDPVNKVGGINHYMMPLWNGDGLASPKYGNIATELLLDKVLEQGGERKYLIAKLFGGASQYEYQSKLLRMGERNAKVAIAMMEKHKIPVSGNSLGGTYPRKIFFNTSTGRVNMKLILGYSRELV